MCGLLFSSKDCLFQTRGYPADAGDKINEFKELAGSMEQVQFNFAKYGLLDQQVKFLKGWF